MAEKRSPFSTCRDCGEQIVWMKTRSGKNIAVEPDSLREGEDPANTVYDKLVHSCHWNPGNCKAKPEPEDPREPPPF